MAHAVLSPSSAKRWIACPPSARQEQKMPNTSNTAADEGTLAHKLAEIILQFETGQINKLQYENKLIEVKTDRLYTADMLDYVTEYTDFVLETYLAARAKTPDALILLEQRLDLTDWVPEGFGTADVQIIGGNVLHLIDLKYGKGVPVFAEKNEQLMAYTLGAHKEHNPWYGIEQAKMTIYQPRLSSVTTFEMEAWGLVAWGAAVLKPAASLAFKGEGEFSPGEHCHFCKIAGTCKANAAFNLQLAKLDFAEPLDVEVSLAEIKPAFTDPVLMADEEISFVLSRAALFLKWLKSVHEHALYSASKQGKKWPGFKLVKGRSNRVIKDQMGAWAALAKANYKLDEFLKPQELKGIGDLEKLVGKNNYESLLGPFTIKPDGAPTLVPLSDKRTELNSLEAAKMDFATEVENETD